MTNNRKPLKLTEQNFQDQVLQRIDPILVDFWADWCGPCHMIAPVIEELAETFADEVTVAKLNVDEYPEVARRYGIQSLPTLLFFKDGQVRDQLVGAASKGVISTKLQTLIDGQ